MHCRLSRLWGLVALLHMYKNSYSKNFILTLIILPAIVQAVIMLVNGNLGTGVAVLGAFSLIRFRSAEGNSREITSLFLAMSIGLATGLGCIGVAGLLLIAIGAAILLVQTLPFSGKRKAQGCLRFLCLQIRRMRLFLTAFFPDIPNLSGL